MSIVKKKFETGLNLKPTSPATNVVQGDIETLSTDGKAHYHNGTSDSPVVTEAHAATLTNKSINASTNTLSNITNTEISASAGIVYSKLSLSNSIVNADISTSAAIVDTKLATISTSGKVSNTATTATDANTTSAIVSRDGSGNFSAGTITANLTGNVSGNATNVTGVVAADHGGTGVANNVASTLTISGSFATTLTVTAGTSVTLPTTGTLSTLAGSEVITNKDHDGGTASNTSRLTVPKNTAATLTGLTRKEATIVYGTDTQLLYVDNGSNLIPVGGNWTVSNSTSLAGGGTIAISTTLSQQVWRVASSGGAISLSSTPFGTSPPPDGTVIRVMGTSDTDTVTITNNDAANGCIVNGNRTLGKFDVIEFQYLSTDARYVEIE